MSFLKILFTAVFLFTLFSCGKEITPEKVGACDGSSQENCDCFKATNKERLNNGLAVMNYCKVCFTMAQEQAEDVDKYHYFSHDRPAVDGRPAETFSQRAARFGLSSGVAENLASGATGNGAVVLWMGSPGHKANILTPYFKSFACGTKNGISAQVFSVNPE